MRYHKMCTGNGSLYLEANKKGLFYDVNSPNDTSTLSVFNVSLEKVGLNWCIKFISYRLNMERKGLQSSRRVR